MFVYNLSFCRKIWKPSRTFSRSNSICQGSRQNINSSTLENICMLILSFIIWLVSQIFPLYNTPICGLSTEIKIKTLMSQILPLHQRKLINIISYKENSGRSSGLMGSALISRSCSWSLTHWLLELSAKCAFFGHLGDF